MWVRVPPGVPQKPLFCKGFSRWIHLRWCVFGEIVGRVVGRALNPRPRVDTRPDYGSEGWVFESRRACRGHPCTTWVSLAEVCDCCRVTPKNLGKFLVQHLLFGSGQEFLSRLTSSRVSPQHLRCVTRPGSSTEPYHDGQSRGRGFESHHLHSRHCHQGNYGESILFNP